MMDFGIRLTHLPLDVRFELFHKWVLLMYTLLVSTVSTGDSSESHPSISTRPADPPSSFDWAIKEKKWVKADWKHWFDRTSLIAYSSHVFGLLVLGLSLAFLCNSLQNSLFFAPRLLWDVPAPLLVLELLHSGLRLAGNCFKKGCSTQPSSSFFSLQGMYVGLSFCLASRCGGNLFTQILFF